MKLQQNFQIFLETFSLEFGLFFKFGIINWFTKQITKFVKRRFKEDPKNFMKFQVKVLKFQF